MVSQGINCVNVDLNKIPTEKLKLFPKSVIIKTIQCDIATKMGQEQIFRECSDLQIDILFNNAAYLLVDV